MTAWTLKDSCTVKACLLAVLALLLAVWIPGRAGAAQDGPQLDWITGLPREDIHIDAWPEGARVAVCFVLNVEVWGFGQGPDFIPGMAERNPDLVNEGFRQHAIHWGNLRVAELFKEQGVPLSIGLNALFPQDQPEVWQTFRALVPDAAIVAHGMNNSNDLLPLGRGLAAQQDYIRKTLDAIAASTGVRPAGWTSPRVYPNGDTFLAVAAESMSYSLDGMDSDILSRLLTPSGPLVLIPYPAVTVDMNQSLTRHLPAPGIARFWLDYVGELAREAAAAPQTSAKVVAIGIHPFVSGTPDGVAALREVLETLTQDDRVWLTDVDQVMDWQGAHATGGTTP